MMRWGMDGFCDAVVAEKEEQEAFVVVVLSFAETTEKRNAIACIKCLLSGISPFLFLLLTTATDQAIH